MTKSEEPLGVTELESIEAVTDEKLTQAIEECIRDDSCLPIIKQELQYTIQYKRLGKGLEEIHLQPEEPPIYLVCIYNCDAYKGLLNI